MGCTYAKYGFHKYDLHPETSCTHIQARMKIFKNNFATTVHHFLLHMSVNLNGPYHY